MAPSFAAQLQSAIARRRRLLGGEDVQALRLFGGEADGAPGVYLDRYGPGAVLIEYEGVAPRGFDARSAAAGALETLRPLGVTAVYHKPFMRDRSKLGGQLPEVVTRAEPLAGEALPEAVTVREHGVLLEVRLYDGLSTGLFLDQRSNRRHLADLCRERPGARVLNTFAYTCAFSAACALAGAMTASVDVSPRYLEWGKRNFALNGLDAAQHRFARMDTFEFLGYARRKELVFDLIILDPPSFAAGNKRKGVRPWSSVDDYADLVREAAAVLAPGGLIFASTNTAELCRPGRLEREVTEGLGAEPSWRELPPMPEDFAGERNRFAAVLFSPRSWTGRTRAEGGGGSRR